MKHYITLTNSEINERINEHIHSERDRKIMRLRLVDGYTHERIADLVELSPAQVKRIIKKHTKLICE